MKKRISRSTSVRIANAGTSVRKKSVRTAKKGVRKASSVTPKKTDSSEPVRSRVGEKRRVSFYSASGIIRMDIVMQVIQENQKGWTKGVMESVELFNTRTLQPINRRA